MNRLSHNPNTRRFGLPLAVTAALIGSAACTSKNNPTPVPSETTASATHLPHPSCTVKAEVHGKTATFSLDAKDEYQPGVYTVEKVEYEYGDGLSGTVSSHTYAKAGSYAVRGSMVMGVVPGLDPNDRPPFGDGFEVPCTAATVNVG